MDRDATESVRCVGGRFDGVTRKFETPVLIGHVFEMKFGLGGDGKTFEVTTYLVTSKSEAQPKGTPLVFSIDPHTHPSQRNQ